MPFLAAAVVTGGAVRITRLAAGQHRSPPSTILDLLREAGLRLCGKRIRTSRCRAPDAYGGFDVDLHDVGELTPAVAALAALAATGSVSRLTRHRASARA